PVCRKYRFCSAFLPVTRTFDALMTMTLSPVSIWGVNVGLCLPRMIFATSVARRPRTTSSASTMYHWCSISRGVAEYVFMCSGTIYECRPPFVRVGSERLIATKWFCDSLLRYLALVSMSTAAQPLTPSLQRDQKRSLFDRSAGGNLHAFHLSRRRRAELVLHLHRFHYHAT